MTDADIHIEYVLDTNTTLYQAYKDSNTLYLYFQESYERLSKAASYDDWIRAISLVLESTYGEELQLALDRLCVLNGRFPVPIQKTSKTFPDGSIGTADFFKKPENVYIFKSTENTIHTDPPVINSPKPLPVIESVPVPKPLSIEDVVFISRNYGKYWKSSISGYEPSTVDGDYYYLIILNDRRKLILTVGEYKQLMKI